MRGTGYAISEIIWWMLAAALIGVAIGWVLYRWLGRGSDQAELEALRKAESATLTEISNKLHASKQKVAALSGDLGKRSSELKRVTAKAAQLEAEVTAARADLDSATARSSSLETQLADARGELEAASRFANEGGAASPPTDTEAQGADIVRLETDLTDVQRRLTEATRELGDVRAAHAACGVATEEHAGVVAGLKAAVAERDERIRLLETQPGSRSDDARMTMTHEELPLFDAGAGPSGSSAGDEATTASRPLTSLGTPGADHADDLTVISGIGKKMERLLNGLGIRSLEQLAQLDDDGVAKIDAALADFPGRIERDEWVRQAGEIMADGHRRPT